MDLDGVNGLSLKVFDYFGEEESRRIDRERLDEALAAVEQVISGAVDSEPETATSIDSTTKIVERVADSAANIDCTLDEKVPTETFMTIHEKSVQIGMILSKEVLQEESKLLQTKLFDRRFSHPSDLTQEFLRQYVTRYKRYWARCFDIRESENKFGVGSLTLVENNSAVILSLWKARQAADKIGCSYEFYLSTTFEYLMEERFWKRLPAPNQLVSSEIFLHVRKCWKERLSEVAYPFPEDPRYIHNDFISTINQRDHKRFLIDRINESRRSNKIDIGLWALSRKLLSAQEVVEEWGQGTLEESQAWIYEHEGAVLDDSLELSDFRPGCFGMPHAFGHGPCNDCEFSTECASAQDAVLKEIASVTGSVDPKDERKRRLARDRQRRRREKQKALKTT